MADSLKIWSAIVSVATLLNIAPSQAAIVTYSLSGTVDSGPLLNQPYSGTFSFDDSLLTSIGSEFLPVPTVTVNFGGTYTQSDAASPPEVSFLDGDLLGLSFSVNTSNLDFSFVPGFFDVSEAYFTYQTPQGAGAGNVIYAPVTAVPEASSVLGILAFGICGLGVRRKRHQTSDSWLKSHIPQVDPTKRVIYLYYTAASE